MFFFCSRYMKRWKEERERGTFRVSGNGFFIVWRVGVFFLTNSLWEGERVHWGKGAS